jgi:hypothetical protein
MRQDQLRPVTDPDGAFALFDEYVQAWLEPLDLHRWVIELGRETDEAADADWASCTASPKYRRATISMNPRRFAEQGFIPLQIESVAVHELTHCILWPGYNEVANPQIPEDVRSYFEEIAADQFAHALMMAKYKSHPAVKTLWRGYRGRAA